MLKHLLKKSMSTLGFEIHRKRDPTLPFIHPIKLDDHQFEFWITNPHTKNWWYKPELKLNGELKMLKKLCMPGDIVFDVGAHHGMLSLAFSLWTGPEGRVFAFEANPENALTLQANIFNNNIANCSCFFTAIGDRKGSISISGESADPKGISSGRETPMISLDRVCEMHQIDRVDLIKIDVEGFEFQVLKGAPRLLSSHPKLAIEIHPDDLPNFGGSIHGIFELLDVERYEISVVARKESWDEIIKINDIEDLPDGIINVFLEPKG